MNHQLVEVWKVVWMGYDTSHQLPTEKCSCRTQSHPPQPELFDESNGSECGDDTEKRINGKDVTESDIDVRRQGRKQDCQRADQWGGTSRVSVSPGPSYDEKRPQSSQNEKGERGFD